MNDTLHISDLTPDNKNLNKHSERGSAFVKKSLEKNGFGRSILIDKDRRIIAGNLTAEEAGQLGMEDVIIVPSDGTKIIAVQRTDITLDSKAGRELALADNRSAEVSLNWDAEQILELQEDGFIEVEYWFFENELGVEVDYSSKNKELSAEEFDGDKVSLSFDLSFDECELIKESLSRYDANKEQALLKALKIND